MNKLIRIFSVSLLTFAVLLLTSALRADEPNRWPPLRTDQDKLQLMLWDRATLPNFFEGMTEYEVNYFDVLEQQHQINTHLMANPTLVPLLSQRPDRVRIEFGPAASVNPAKAPKIDQQAISAYIQSLRQAYQQIASKPLTLDGLKELILSTEKIYRDLSIKNFTMELVNLLPPAQRKQVFPLSVEEKLKIFTQQITDEVLSKVEAKKLKYLSIQTSRDIPTVLDALVKRDRDLESLYALACLALKQIPANTEAQAVVAAGAGPVVLNFEKLSQQQLAVFADKKMTFDTLATLLSPNSAKIGAEALSQPRALFGHLAEQKTTNHTLTEMPVTLSWVSSCVGGECSTKNMAAYSNLPTLRKLFVDLGPDGASGFFEVQLVEAYGTRYLLVNMVQGRHLSPELAVQSLIALSQRVHELGAEALMLPTWDNLGWHTNYNELREPLRALVAGKSETHYVYLDNELREALRPYVNNSEYYTIDSRNKGVIIRAEDLTGFKDIKSSLGKAPAFPFQKTQISIGEAALISFEVEEVAGMKDVASRILKALKIPSEKYSIIKAALFNDQRLSTKQYFENVASVLKSNGYEFDTTFKKNRLNSLYPGFLRCPDAWSSEWQKKAFEASLSLLQRQGTVGLINESVRNESGRKLNLAALSQIRTALLKDLNKKYLDRRAAGALLIAFKTDYEKVLPVLFGLARESDGFDQALNLIFKEALALDSAKFKEALLHGLSSEQDWIQQGALIALEQTHFSDPEVLDALHAIQNGMARSHSAYEISLRITKNRKVDCNAVFVTH